MGVGIEDFKRLWAWNRPRKWWIRSALIVIVGFLVADWVVADCIKWRTLANGSPVTPAVGQRPPTSFAGDKLSWSLTTFYNSTSTHCTVPIAEASPGDLVHIAPPPDWPSGVELHGYVSAAGTVTLDAVNGSGTTQTIPTASSDTYKVWISR
jgi:hypothetical protein